MNMARLPDAEVLLTPKEVAARFHVNPKTVTRWAKAGKLTAIRTLGGHKLCHCCAQRPWQSMSKDL
jgi:excisionase family DNA binding protein